MPADDPPVALEARRAIKRYGNVLALDDVTLSVPEGACVALVGESGSGKTTLLRCFNRMVQPESGEIRVEGKRVDGLDPVELRRALGYVQQEGGLLPHWPVLRNAAMVPWLRGVPDAEAQARAALDLVGLSSDLFDRYPAQLSGGQRQRAALARALAGTRSALLLDEPFGALDAITRVGVRRMFEGVRRELGLATLLVTHDLQEAFSVADRIAVMRAGRIEQVAAPGVLLRAPESPYVERLLDTAGVA